LNKFIIATIPAELLINIPAAAYLFGYKKNWLLFHPGVSIIELCSKGHHRLASIFVLLVWTAFFTMLANGAVRKMFKSVGGVRL
jgi:fluoroquinolone transport system permease protein